MTKACCSVIKYCSACVAMGIVMKESLEQFEERKQDHIKLALMDENQAADQTIFESVGLIHEAMPDFDFDDIEITTQRFGKTVNPFLVSSMTAGHRDSVNINHRLIESCSLSGWAMGVGSQRRELTDKNAALEWQQLRRDFPKVSLYSNLGIAQLITTPLAEVERLTDALQADGIFIHCNPLQECIQPEGTPNYKGCWEALEKLVSYLSIPVIIKETGCGLSASTMARLNNLGIAAVDVSGLGGTHWGRIEGHRAVHDVLRHQTARTFKNWGIDTVSAIQKARAINPSFEIWGSGGVINGLNAAKLFALGASTVGFARPILEGAMHSVERIINTMKAIEYELKVAMFCTGSRQLVNLKEKLC